MAYITQKHVWELPFPVYIEKYLVDPSSNMTAKYYSTSVLDPQLNTSNKHILSAHLLNFVQGMKFRNRKCLLMKKEQTTTSENSAPNAVFVEMSGSPTSSTESNMIWGSIYNYARWMLGYPSLDMTQSTDVTNIPFLWNSFKTRLGYGETLGAPPLSSDSTPASKPAGTGSAGTKASSPEMSGSPTSFTESNTVWSSMYDYARWMFGYPPSDTTQSTDVTDTPSLWNSFKTRLGYGETSVATQLSSDSTPASRTPGVSPLSSDSTETSKTSGPRSAGIRESSIELFTQPNSFHQTDESDIDSRERLREFDANLSENEPSHSRTERSRSILSTGKRTSGGKLVKFDEQISASKSDLTETTEPGLGKNDLMTRTDSFDDSGSHNKKGQLFYKIVAVKDSIDSIHVEVSGASIDVVAPPETETEGNAKKR